MMKFVTLLLLRLLFSLLSSSSCCNAKRITTTTTIRILQQPEPEVIVTNGTQQPQQVDGNDTSTNTSTSTSSNTSDNPVCNVCSNNDTNARIGNISELLQIDVNSANITCDFAQKMGDAGVWTIAMCTRIQTITSATGLCQCTTTTTTNTTTTNDTIATNETISSSSSSLPPQGNVTTTNNITIGSGLVYERCNICGSNYTDYGISIPMGPVPILGASNVTISCAFLSVLGKNGLLDPIACDYFQNSDQASTYQYCGCKPGPYNINKINHDGIQLPQDTNTNTNTNNTSTNNTNESSSSSTSSLQELAIIGAPKARPTTTSSTIAGTTSSSNSSSSSTTTTTSSIVWSLLSSSLSWISISFFFHQLLL